MGNSSSAFQACDARYYHNLIESDAVAGGYQSILPSIMIGGDGKSDSDTIAADITARISGYSTSKESAVKEKVIKLVAKTLIKMGIKDIKLDVPLEQLADSVSSYIQKIASIDYNALSDEYKRNILLCIIDEVNNMYSPGSQSNKVINADKSQTTKALGENLLHVFHSLISGPYLEINRIKSSIQLVIRNIVVLQKLANELTQKLKVNDNNLSAEEKQKNAESVIIIGNIAKELKSQFEVLTRMLDVSIPEGLESNISRATSDGNMLFEILRRVGNSEDSTLNELIIANIRGLEMVVGVYHTVDKALKEVGASMKQFVESANWKDFEKLIKSQKDSPNMIEYIHAVEVLKGAYKKRKSLHKSIAEKTGGDLVVHDSDAIWKQTDDDKAKIEQEEREKMLKKQMEFIKSYFNVYDERLTKIGDSLSELKYKSGIKGIKREVLEHIKVLLVGLLKNESITYKLALIEYYEGIKYEQMKTQFLSDLDALKELLKGYPELESVHTAISSFEAVIALFTKHVLETLRKQVVIPPARLSDIIPSRSVALKKLDLILSNFTHFSNVQGIRESMMKTAKEISEYRGDYLRSLGDAVAGQLERLQADYLNMLKAEPKMGGIKDHVDTIADRKKTFPKNTDLTNARDISEEILHEHKMQYETKVEFYRTLENIDMYLNSFHTKVSENPDAVKSIKTELDGVHIISNWYSQETGNQLVYLFECCPSEWPDTAAVGRTKSSFLTDQDPRPLNNNAYLGLISTVSATNNHAEGTFVLGGLGPVPMGTKAARNLDRYINLILNSYQVLKNLISMFVNIGDSFTERLQDSSQFMSTHTIYKNLMAYMKYSSIPVGLHKNGGYTKPWILNANKCVSYNPFPTKGANARAEIKYQDAPSCRYIAVIDPPCDPTSLGMKFAIENHYFKVLIKAMAGKILSVVHLHQLLEHTSPDAGYTTVRVLFGGGIKTEGKPQIKTENIEIYARFIRALEFYIDLFSFHKLTYNNSNELVISISPDSNNEFSDVIKLMFEMRHYVKDVNATEIYNYPTRILHKYVAIVNSLMDKHKDPQVLMYEFVKDINKRFGAYRSKYLQRQLIDKASARRQHDSIEDLDLENQDSDVLSNNYDLFPKDSVDTFIGPSDKYKIDATRIANKDANDRIVLWRPGKFNIDIDFTKENAFHLFHDFRRRIDDLLTVNYDKVDFPTEDMQYFTHIIKTGVEKMSKAQSEEAKYDVFLNLVQRQNEFITDTRDIKFLFFHETVQLGLNALEAFIRHYKALKDTIIDLKFLQDGLKMIFEGKNGTITSALGKQHAIVHRTTPAQVVAEIHQLFSCYNGNALVNHQDTIDTFDPDFYVSKDTSYLSLAHNIYNEFFPRRGNYTQLPCPEDYIRLGVKIPEVLESQIQTTHYMNKMFPGLFTIIPHYTNGTYAVESSELYKYVKGFINDIKYFLGKFTGVLPDDVIRRTTQNKNDFGLDALEVEFHKMFEVRETLKGYDIQALSQNAPTEQSYTYSERLAILLSNNMRIINKSYGLVSLSDQYQRFVDQDQLRYPRVAPGSSIPITLLIADTDHTPHGHAGPVSTRNTPAEKIKFGNILARMITWDNSYIGIDMHGSFVQHGLSHRGEEFYLYNRKPITDQEYTYSETKPNDVERVYGKPPANIWGRALELAGYYDFKTSNLSVLTGNKSIYFAFNSLLSSFLYSAFDSSQKKIYRPIVSNLYDSILHECITNQTMAQPDMFIASHTPFGFRADPAPKSLLFESLANVIDNLYSRRTLENTYLYTFDDINQVSETTKLVYKKNMGLYKRLFTELKEYAQIILNVLKSTQLNLARNYPRYRVFTPATSCLETQLETSALTCNPPSKNVTPPPGLNTDDIYTNCVAVGSTGFIRLTADNRTYEYFENITSADKISVAPFVPSGNAMVENLNQGPPTTLVKRDVEALKIAHIVATQYFKLDPGRTPNSWPNRLQQEVANDQIRDTTLLGRHYYRDVPFGSRGSGKDAFVGSIDSVTTSEATRTNLTGILSNLIIAINATITTIEKVESELKDENNDIFSQIDPTIPVSPVNFISEKPFSPASMLSNIYKNIANYNFVLPARHNTSALQVLLTAARGILLSKKSISVRNFPTNHELLIKFNNTHKKNVDEQRYTALLQKIMNSYSRNVLDYIFIQNIVDRSKLPHPVTISCHSYQPYMFRLSSDKIVSLSSRGMFDAEIEKFRKGIMERSYKSHKPESQRQAVTLRKKEWLLNFMDYKIMPIQIASLCRTIPFSNLFNFSYTFERLCCNTFKGSYHEIEQTISFCPHYQITQNQHPIHKTQLVHPTDTTNFFLRLLFAPYEFCDGTLYGLTNYNDREGGVVARYFRGDSELPFGTPKFLCDQLSNKALMRSARAYGIDDDAGFIPSHHSSMAHGTQGPVGYEGIYHYDSPIEHSLLGEVGPMLKTFVQCHSKFNQVYQQASIAAAKKFLTDTSPANNPNSLASLMCLVSDLHPNQQQGIAETGYKINDVRTYYMDQTYLDFFKDAFENVLLKAQVVTGISLGDLQNMASRMLITCSNYYNSLGRFEGHTPDNDLREFLNICCTVYVYPILAALPAFGHTGLEDIVKLTPVIANVPNPVTALQCVSPWQFLYCLLSSYKQCLDFERNGVALAGGPVIPTPLNSIAIRGFAMHETQYAQNEYQNSITFASRLAPDHATQGHAEYNGLYEALCTQHNTIKAYASGVHERLAYAIQAAAQGDPATYQVHLAHFNGPNNIYQPDAIFASELLNVAYIAALVIAGDSNATQNANGLGVVGLDVSPLMQRVNTDKSLFQTFRPYKNVEDNILNGYSQTANIGREVHVLSKTAPLRIQTSINVRDTEDQPLVRKHRYYITYFNGKDNQVSVYQPKSQDTEQIVTVSRNRFNTVITRHLMFLSNVVRALRYHNYVELNKYQTVIVNSHVTTAPEITEFADKPQFKLDQTDAYSK